MTNRTFLVVMSIMMVTFIAIMFFLSNIETTNKRLEQDKIKNLRDSLEMEYYKKQLESYPYDHSKIPTNDTIK
jgi:pyruvate dehydrogenase complex dehydrogenase (E1) component